ncbi:hypothetical protein [Streptomyces liangshanensis]|uniref:hypothetical protein n=1 Tax=Streptomyces liangshanensis TaxID=2717324 RepID=UPI0036D9BC58
MIGLTACDGDEESTAKGVDTLVSGSPGAKSTDSPDAAASAAAVDAKRPQLRLDTSLKEQQQLTDAYNACLQAHGVPMNTKRAAAAGTKQAPPLQDPNNPDKYRPAYDACLVKLPLLPPEISPDNPKYDDMMRAEVKCLNTAGDKVKLTFGDDGHVSGWTYLDSDPGLSISAREAIEDKCHKQAFNIPAGSTLS